MKQTLIISDIQESILIGEVKFPFCDSQNPKDFINIRKLGHGLTTPIWITMRATYNYEFNEVYNRKTCILIFNN